MNVVSFERRYDLSEFIGEVLTMDVNIWLVWIAL